MDHRFSVLAFWLLCLIQASCSESPQQKEGESNHTAKVEWELVESPTKSHLRGLDVGSDGTIWASGTEGTVLKSLDSGKSWVAFQIPGCDQLDFRDVEGFDASDAVVMSSGNGVHFYRTQDGGSNWSLTYQDTNRAIFFDGMDFNGDYGLAYGDPQHGKLQILQSKDRGHSWSSMNTESMPRTIDGEAGFAASGTGIVLGKSALWIATGGGKEARVFRLSADTKWAVTPTTLASSPSAGIFSIAFFDDRSGIAVGGDYIDSTRNFYNAAFTTDGGVSWKGSTIGPGGYRSCVCINPSGIAIATGRTGTDYSNDFGNRWKALSTQGYFSCVAFSDYILFVGRNGGIKRLKEDFEKLSN